MELQYEGLFLEAAVFLCARQRNPPVPAAQVHRFHWERERVYRVLDPDERERRFYDVHLAWFREWGLEERWRRILEEYPLILQRLDRMVLCRPQRRSDAGVELYVDGTAGASAVLAISPEMLVSGRGLEAFLRHEFLHLQDMLDPAFGYEPVLPMGGRPAGLEPVVRERYRLLWDISIDGRLDAAGLPAPGSRDRYAAALERGFPCWSAAQREEVLTRLWRGSAVTHAELAAWATDPRGLQQNTGPAPGAACPLCGFPSFDWAPATKALALECGVRRDFPWWEPQMGLCGRCAELYEVRSKLPAPPLAA